MWEKRRVEMQTPRSILAISLGLLVVLALACKFSASTANITSLKIGKDKAVTTESSSFGPNDTIYAIAPIGNAPGKVKVKGRLVVEDVAGQKTGPVAGLEDTIELGGSGTATFNFTPPAAGWPVGKYKVEVIMMNEDGEQKDQKSASFSVS
jgi:hypothetical protein